MGGHGKGAGWPHVFVTAVINTVDIGILREMVTVCAMVSMMAVPLHAHMLFGRCLGRCGRCSITNYDLEK